MTEIRLPCWQFRGSLDDAPGWVRETGAIVSEGRVTEMLAGGRQGVHGETVLRLASGEVVGCRDYLIKNVGPGVAVLHEPDFRQRYGDQA